MRTIPPNKRSSYNVQCFFCCCCCFVVVVVVVVVFNNANKQPFLLLLRCTISVTVARHVPQCVHDSVSNVSHLPAVNNRVQRGIET